ncbi:hypothetical protein CCACVL1_26398 [Corchorus capsularis]|uniref:Uncharacterized protein n=1 Tax=Corchorus capsularis TaxID=210143 RepID=A0A1R3GEX9_COCAP|nr:hypothetical protein CCACVL1_26398 [Corchorus capsularis]
MAAALPPDRPFFTLRHPNDVTPSPISSLTRLSLTQPTQSQSFPLQFLQRQQFRSKTG